MKKVLAMLLVVVMSICCIGVVPAMAGEVDEVIMPNYISDMSEYDSYVAFGYETDFSLPIDGRDEYNLVQLNVDSDSFVVLDIQACDSMEDSFYGGSSWGYLYIYTNKLMTQEVASMRYGIGSGEAPKTKSGILVLPKGSYYLKLLAHRNCMFGGEDFSINAKLAVTSIKTKNAITVTSESSSDGHLVTFQDKFNGNLENVYYYNGTWDFGSNTYDLKPLEVRDGTAILQESGYYTFVFSTREYRHSVSRFNSVIVRVKVCDTTKPKVSGVENGKTYKKNVIVKFSDESGIKSATLNGKKIKSGIKVTKNGSYTLVVVDKAGNKRTVKFKIKK